MSIGVVSFQWFFWGYSLTFSHTGSSYIGDLSNFGLMQVLGQPSVGSTHIPDLLFCLYQGMFAAITYVSLDAGGSTCMTLLSQASRGKTNSLCYTGLPSPSALLLTAAVCCPASYSSLSGPLSSTTRSPTGPGTPTAGRSSSAVSTSPVALLVCCLSGSWVSRGSLRSSSKGDLEDVAHLAYLPTYTAPVQPY